MIVVNEWLREHLLPRTFTSIAQECSHRLDSDDLIHTLLRVRFIDQLHRLVHSFDIVLVEFFLEHASRFEQLTNTGLALSVTLSVNPFGHPSERPVRERVLETVVRVFCATCFGVQWRGALAEEDREDGSGASGEFPTTLAVAQ